MVFSSVTFLYAFLPMVLLVYFAVPKRLKNAVLLVSSLVFYFFGEPIYIFLLIFSSLSDYLHSLYIERHRGEKGAKRALVSSIAINVLMLCFFKYSGFFAETLNSIFDLGLPVVNIPLPLGISFFTFQTMSYTIDVYRGNVHAQKNLANLSAYVCLFPQLVAGPIVRYKDIERELVGRKTDADAVALCARRFVLGLAKKVLIADSMGTLCAAFSATDDKSVLFCWMNALAFALQIYFDFSGYSDMAVGLGKIFGFSFPENFDYPYLSRSVTEFWRRWHITLGAWFRDYVYIPMGGNRVSKMRWVLNIAVVWLLTGLWHGAQWNFALWGLFYAVLLLLEKLFLKGFLERHRIFSHIYVIFITLVLFAVFNSDGISDAAAGLSAMFGLAGLPLVSAEALYQLKNYAVLLLAAVVGATPLIKNCMRRLLNTRAAVIIEPVLLSVLLLLSTAFIVDGSFSPFLYFRF